MKRTKKTVQKPAWAKLNTVKARLELLRSYARGTRPDQCELRAHEHPKEPERNKK